MECSEFIGRVREKARLTPEKAAQVVEATLKTLAERFGREARENFAVLLPRKLKPLFFQWKESEEFDVEEFYSRVRRRASLEAPREAELIKTVFSVLEEFISRQEWENIILVLPPKYQELFGGGLAGAL